MFNFFRRKKRSDNQRATKTDSPTVQKISQQKESNSNRESSKIDGDSKDLPKRQEQGYGDDPLWKPFYVRFGIDPQLFENTKIEELDLSVRLYNVLKDHKCKTVSSFLGLSEQQLSNFRKIGKTSVHEAIRIVESLKEGLPSKETKGSPETCSDYEEQETFEKRFGHDCAQFDEISIDNLELSVRLRNVLKRNSCRYVGDFLRLSEVELLNYKNAGKTCVTEAVKVAKNLDRYFKGDYPRQDKKNDWICSVFRTHKEEILTGDFSKIREIAEDDKESLAIETLEKAYEDLGSEIVCKCQENPDEIIAIINALNIFCKPFVKSQRRKVTIRQAYDVLPEDRKNTLLAGLVNAYSLDDDVRSFLLKDMPADSTLLSFRDVCIQKASEIEFYNEAISFLNWCKFDLGKEIDVLIQLISDDPRSYEICKLRARGSTLEEIGKLQGITRERVRQIEAKTKRRFEAKLRNHNIVRKIYAVRNQDVVLTPVELEEYFGEYTQEFLYFMRTIENAGYDYDTTYDVFYVENKTMAESVQDYLEALPDQFVSSRYDSIIEEGIEEYGLTEEILSKAIQEQYKKTGELFHRSRLRLADIYADVLKKYYPEGIHVYDSGELEKFRAYIANEYGITDIPQEDRTLGSGIVRISVLCDRGVYRLREKSYISKALSDKIEEYIDKSESSIFLMNTLFEVFQDELEEQGVNNKYYLQGILKEEYGDKYIFSRDYLSKDSSITSIYSDIVGYIKKSEYPVTKEEIYRRYPGITSIVVSFAVSDPKVLNYFGSYLHGTKLRYSDSEKKKIYLYLEDGLRAYGGYAHGKDIYDSFKIEFSEFLDRNAISMQYSLLSVLGYMFADQMVVERPYLAFKGVEVNKPTERMREFVYESEIHTIAETIEFAQEIHYPIYVILDFVSQFSDDYLLISNKAYANYEYIGVTDEIMNSVVALVQKEITETTPISSLKCVHEFPKINIPWNEWLIYSILCHSTEEIDIGTSSNQLKTSVPVVAPKGRFDADSVKDLRPIGDGTICEIDDLDNIDALIEEFIEDEIEL